MTLDEAERSGRATLADALRLFDAADAVDPAAMAGTWRGSELPSGHPLDGLLAACGWYGKRFVDAERVDPLLFYTGDRRAAFRVDPARLAVRLPLAFSPPRLPYHGLLLAARPLLQAHGFKARLRRVEHRGQLSAAMIYDDKPILDHFRRLDADTLLGAMDLRGDARPYFFVLRRDAGMPVV